MASSRLVLPLANGPTIAIDRGPVLRPLSLILPPLPQHGACDSPDAACWEAERQFQPFLQPESREKARHERRPTSGAGMGSSQADCGLASGFDCLRADMMTPHDAVGGQQRGPRWGPN